MKPIYIHSGMTGAPQYANANDSINAILTACLTPDGFNLKTATSASASGGVLTLNFATDPGFEALQTVEVAVSSVAMVNGQHRVIANSSNQVTIAIPGLPDGAVGSSGAGITIKQAGAGWSKPFSASTKAVFRPPAGSRRYLRVVNAVGANTQARAYEEMTDVDTGTEPFPTVQQVPTPEVLYNVGYEAVSGAPWFVIVTPKWVYFSLTNVLDAPYSVSVGTFFFGELAHPTVAADYYCTTLRLGGGENYLARGYDGIPGAVSATSRDFDGSSSIWPSVIAGGARFIPYIPVVESLNILRGVLPNAYKVYPHVPSANFLDIYSNVLGSTSRMKPISPYPRANMTYCIAIDEEAWD